MHILKRYDFYEQLQNVTDAILDHDMKIVVSDSSAHNAHGSHNKDRVDGTGRRAMV